jgi:hypothetical protein
MRTIQEISDLMREALAELEREADALRAALAEIDRQHAASRLPGPRAAERGASPVQSGESDGKVTETDRNGAGPPPAGVPVAVDAPPAKPRRWRQSPDVDGAAPVKVLLAGQLERMLEDNREGLSAAEIAKRAGAAYGQVGDLLAELQNAGKVHRTGQRRGTRWHALPDEEWIARRAAELEHRTKVAASG